MPTIGIFLAFLIYFGPSGSHNAKAGELIGHPAVESVREAHTIPSIKRSVVVRLNTAVSESELAQIATKIKGKVLRSFERTFIEYYIPGMKEGAGAWATTHFDPNLEVRILGNVQRFDKMSEAEAREALANELRAQPGVAELLSDVDFQNREMASWASVSCDGMSGTDELYGRFRQSKGEGRSTYSSASYVTTWEFEHREAQGEVVISCEDAWELYGSDGTYAKNWLSKN